MLIVSYTARERLALLLAEEDAPDDAAFRFFAERDGFRLAVDTARPGDTTFAHGEKVVLAIDEQVSELLADMKLDVTDTEEEPKLVLNEQIEKVDGRNEEQPTTGARGRVTTSMTPSGKVLIDGIEYNAWFKSGLAESGDEVVVVGLDALGLIVDKPDSQAQANQNGPE